MNAYLKSLSLAALVVAVVFLASVPAQAVTVTFGGVPAGDSSGLTSQYANTDNSATFPYFIETFDGTAPNGNGTYGLTNGGSVTVESGGWFMSLDEATDLYVSGTIGIRTTTAGYAAAPAGDNTNFAYAPSQGGGLPVTVRVEYAADLADPSKFLGYRISYLGLYYGSIDIYNQITFYSNGQTTVTGDDILSDGMITGTELLEKFYNLPIEEIVALGLVGDQSSPLSNVYLNLYFNPNETFTAFELYTNGVACEVDNIMIGLSVPEPATLLLLGLGLVGLAGARRRFKK